MNDDIKIPVLLGDEIHHLDLTVLLRGIVPAEMPFDWPDEALACQAVLARSYVLRAYGWGWRHIGDSAAICDNPAHCLAYAPKKAHEKTDYAVSRTRGLVLTYRQEIAKIYWSCYCGGKTRSNYDAGWVEDPEFELPYLPSRDCGCPKYRSEVVDLLNEEGRFGHGVGFCQYGGRYLAETGYHWKTILRRYFRGDVILKAWNIPWTSRVPEAERGPASS